ncbi:MAG: hypothetical protein JWR51_2285 [Devosia sp.]|uniref:ThiF family adenylyltransferase n=1 Tax=Devosia sp. TaxID=1871048 RepID=UPI00260EDD92|nr:ThiF family adenylyltransferase [Devosia sp.]MDB5529182.1 hypothetical protein [Devosia sp.]
MRFWWVDDTNRLGEEMRSVTALGSNEAWFTLTRWRFFEGMLCAEVVVTAHGHDYPVRLIYPDQFPEVPAWVEPQEKVHWSSHQYGESALCLELRPDNWHPAATGVDVLRSAHDLLHIENPLGGGTVRAETAHQPNQAQAYTWWGNPVMISDGCAARIHAGTASGLVALRFPVDDKLWPIVVHDEIDRAGLQRPPTATIEKWQIDVPVFVSTSSPPSDADNRAGLAVLFDADLMLQVLASTAGVTLFVKEGGIDAYNLLPDGASEKRVVYVLPDEFGARSGRSGGAASESATIVGCGSVGSKVAESLLRSGITSLTLVDGDVFLPGNLERHVLDWNQVGLRKVEALKNRLLSIVPGATIKPIADNLSWQRSAETHAWQVQAIAASSIIIDATGDPATSLFLGAVADANEKPFVSVEVFEGGIGALVATSLPERDPPFVAGRASFLAWCEERGKKPPQSGPRRYEMISDGVPVVADDAAIEITAGNCARVVLDILDGRPQPRSAAWLLLGYSDQWLFDGHGDNIRLDVGGRSHSGEKMPPDFEALDIAGQLFKEWIDALDTGS